MPSMLVIKCLTSTDKYKEGVVYVVKADVAERLVAVLPDCFEFDDDVEEDPYDDNSNSSAG